MTAESSCSQTVVFAKDAVSTDDEWARKGTSLDVSQHIYLRPLESIESKDLNELESAVEGWFLEFKERAPEPAKLAKSLSSFANAHGGLLVIGAKENQKTRRLEAFSPMSRVAADDCITQIRNSAVAHLSPAPFFEAKAFEIPDSTLTSENRWVVLVKIPQGRQGPYLHSSGCIYTRIGDSASPVALNDVGLLERLWSERKERKERLKSRVEFLSAQTHTGNPSVTLVVALDENVRSEPGPSSFEEFQRIARIPVNANAQPLFDNVYPLDSSYVARRTESTIGMASLCWDYDYRRKLHFVQIPIATHQWSGQEFEDSPHNTSWELAELGNYLYAKAKDSSLLVLNLLPTLYFLAVVVHKIRTVHRCEGLTGELRLNAKAINVRRSIAYLGIPRYMSHAEAWGLPFVHRDVDFVRPLEDLQSWCAMDICDPYVTSDSVLAMDYSSSFVLFILLARSLGISHSVSAGIDTPDRDEPDMAPLIKVFSELASKNFSFSSVNNPHAT